MFGGGELAGYSFIGSSANFCFLPDVCNGPFHQQAPCSASLAEGTGEKQANLPPSWMLLGRFLQVHCIGLPRTAFMVHWSSLANWVHMTGTSETSLPYPRQRCEHQKDAQLIFPTTPALDTLNDSSGLFSLFR